jgi:hypothetical protein
MNSLNIEKQINKIINGKLVMGLFIGEPLMTQIELLNFSLTVDDKNSEYMGKLQ